MVHLRRRIAPDKGHAQLRHALGQDLPHLLGEPAEGVPVLFAGVTSGEDDRILLGEVGARPEGLHVHAAGDDVRGQAVLFRQQAVAVLGRQRQHRVGRAVDAEFNPAVAAVVVGRLERGGADAQHLEQAAEVQGRGFVARHDAPHRGQVRVAHEVLAHGGEFGDDDRVVARGDAAQTDLVAPRDQMAHALVHHLVPAEGLGVRQARGEEEDAHQEFSLPYRRAVSSTRAARD